MASKIQTGVRVSLIFRQNDSNIMGLTSKGLALLKSLITNSSQNLLKCGNERKVVAIAKPVHRDSTFIFHTCFLGKQQKKNLNYKDGACLFLFIFCSYKDRGKGFYSKNRTRRQKH